MSKGLFLCGRERGEADLLTALLDGVCLEEALLGALRDGVWRRFWGGYYKSALDICQHVGKANLWARAWSCLLSWVAWFRLDELESQVRGWFDGGVGTCPGYFFGLEMDKAQDVCYPAKR